MESVKSRLKHNLIVLPSGVFPGQFTSKDFSLDVDYVFVESAGGKGRLFSANTVLRWLIDSGGSLSTIDALKGDLEYQFLDDKKTLLELTDLVTDYVVVCNSVDKPAYVIDNARDQRNLEMFGKIIENFQEEIFVTDNEGKILLINPRGAQILGLDASELIGRSVIELVQNEIISSSGALAVLNSKKRIDILQFLKKGRKWRLCSGVPVLNRRGEIVITLCTSKDMTELINIKQELENKEDELKRKDSELSIMQDELFAQVNFISRSAPMREIKRTIAKIAPVDLTVLILGETGVGKEVAARAIHALSPRRNAPFIKISCASFPETLISSELFGYESGSFTGADSKGRKGKIELAHGGTLFLDEIGEISLDLQVKLLEFLQDMELYRIGGTKKIKVNTRIIAATNRNLQIEVQEGRFRKDLFYRLNYIPITLPPFRERCEDIPALISYYLDLYNRKYKKNVSFEDEVVQEFMDFEWPGNVRELEHVIERAVVIHDSGLGAPEISSDLLIGDQSKKKGVQCPEIIPYKQAKRQLERELVVKAYRHYGSTYKAAQALCIAQSTVARIIKRYEIAEK